MATTVSFSLSFTLSSDQQPHKRLLSFHSPPNLQNPFLTFHKSCHPTYKFSFFSSNSSSSSSSTTTETEPISSSASTTYSYLDEDYKPGRFLSNDEIDKLKALQDFRYVQELETGSMYVRVMKSKEMDIAVKLLAESFVESMLLPVAYVSLLRFLVKQYLIERRAAMPHAVTLIGFYTGKDGKRSCGYGEEEEEDEVEENEEEELAGTVEVCFDKRGANASPPTPTPPKNSPYICNMAVKKSLRRRGIGWNLLKASEELISQMSCMREVYLHCRMIDSAPFNMYIKAGYNIVNTDSIWVLLMLQRRKHLMCKKLSILEKPSELDSSVSETELS